MSNRSYVTGRKKGGDTCDVHCINPGKVSKARKRIPGAREIDSLSLTFKVLSDPTRIKIISSLLAGELCVCDLTEILGISQSAVSHQLQILRNLNLVACSRRGKMVYYSLSDAHISTLLTQAITHIKE